MPSRKTTKAAEAAAARLPSIPKECIDQFVSGSMSAEAVQDISMAVKKALIIGLCGPVFAGRTWTPPMPSSQFATARR
jgi:ABC-type uncharacterized transport system ATPase subunit